MMVFGWHAGCGCAVSRLSLFPRRALQCHVNTGGPRPTASITELLKRAFLGWLRGEPDHCHMAAIPTLDQEDARRPNRELEKLVGQRTRIINRMKACLVCLGIRNFKP